MVIMSDRIVSVTEANQNFNKVTDQAKQLGDVVIFKRNKPALVMFDVETMGEDFMREYEQLKLKYLSEEIMKEYKRAYQELSK
jgi:antitoxin Phd